MLDKPHTRLTKELERLTPDVVAEQLGVARSTVYNWMNKGGISLDKLEQLSSRLGTDLNYIFYGQTQSNKLDNSIKQDQHLHIVNESVSPSYINDFIHVPRYDVQASAGAGSVVNDESIVDHLAFKRDWIVRTLGLDPKRLALLDVVGDSMTPTINDGDLILLDTREGQALAEGIYVINFSNSLLVKRLRMRLSGVVDVVSDNERYGIETISGDQLNALQIVGRVVWQGRRI